MVWMWIGNSTIPFSVPVLRANSSASSANNLCALCDTSKNQKTKAVTDVCCTNYFRRSAYQQTAIIFFDNCFLWLPGLDGYYRLLLCHSLVRSEHDWAFATMLFTFYMLQPGSMFWTIKSHPAVQECEQVKPDRSAMGGSANIFSAQTTFPGKGQGTSVLMKASILSKASFMMGEGHTSWPTPL